MIGLMLAAAPVADMPQIQRQLDFIVARCRAEDIVRFVARDGNAVSIEMVQPGRLPSVSEAAALQCATGKVRERADLRLSGAKQTAGTKGRNQ